MEDPDAKVVSSDPEETFKEERCDKDLPTLSVGIDNLIKTKPEWDKFVKENPLFVVGGADSTCPGCCDSEIILRDLLEYTKDKARLSYPEKHKK